MQINELNFVLNRNSMTDKKGKQARRMTETVMLCIHSMCVLFLSFSVSPPPLDQWVKVKFLPRNFILAYVDFAPKLDLISRYGASIVHTCLALNLKSKPMSAAGFFVKCHFVTTSICSLNRF